MSATLPPINHSPGKGPTPQYASPEHSAMQPSPGPRRLQPIKVVCSKRERDMLAKMQNLRSKQPYLTKLDTAVYRNSYIHTMYLDMLQAGFHRSFSELFALIKQQQEERERAGPDSILWNKVMLDDEPEKLDQLNIYLTKAEAAGRENRFADVYDSQFTLARYFLTTGDKWLSDHFFASCLATCQSAPGQRRKLAEAHCNMGLAVEEAGNHEQAAEHFEAFYNLAGEHTDWITDEEVTLYTHACTHLARIYNAIAESLAQHDMKQCVEYLLKAHEKAKESDNKKLEGEACFRLGVGYEKSNEYDKALHFLKRYHDVCKVLEDAHGLGLACEAIARCYERQGKVDESIRYLKLFVEVAEENNLDQDVSRACSDLGAIFNSLSRYEEAAEYFTKAYNISRALNDKEAISASRVQYGIAIAHKMLANIANHIEHEGRTCVTRMLDWKNSRADAFVKEIPEETSGSQSRMTMTSVSEANKTPSQAPTPAPGSGATPENVGAAGTNENQPQDE